MIERVLVYTICVCPAVSLDNDLNNMKLILSHKETREFIVEYIFFRVIKYKLLNNIQGIDI